MHVCFEMKMYIFDSPCTSLSSVSSFLQKRIVLCNTNICLTLVVNLALLQEAIVGLIAADVIVKIVVIEQKTPLRLGESAKYLCGYIL